VTPFGFALRFYLGLGAPAVRRRYPDCTVRAAAAYSPDLVRTLLSLYVGQAGPEVGRSEPVKPGSSHLTLASGEQFFFKEFPRRHAGHDLERALRISRVDRAWRAAHLLPHLGLHTPAAVGTARRREANGSITEYLATVWLEGAVQFPVALPASGPERADMLREFAALMRRCHRSGVYTRDLVKNVLVQTEGSARTYSMVDLDGVHPLRRVTRRRILFHMKQLAHYCPLSEEEARVVCEEYLGTTEGKWAAAVREALRPSGHS